MAYDTLTSRDTHTPGKRGIVKKPVDGTYAAIRVSYWNKETVVPITNEIQHAAHWSCDDSHAKSRCLNHNQRLTLKIGRKQKD
jgi:hypothetical protein